MINKRYKIKLDIVNKFPTDRLNFSLSDVNSSVINIEVSNRDKIVDLTNAIVVIGVTDPNNKVGIDMVKVDQAKDGLVSYVIKPEFKSVVGKWQARLMLILGDDKVVTNTFSYEVKPDEFITINEQASIDERFPLLTDMLSRLAEIEATELGRVEAEKQRQISVGNMRTDVDKLISDANKKINDYKSEIDSYRLAKDTEINLDLTQYKQAKDLEINNHIKAKEAELEEYRKSKDVLISQDLADYKSTTTTEIDNYKNSKNVELDEYKTSKDGEIDTYVANKNKELDRYVADKNNDIDNYKNSKDTLINDKLREVDTAEQSRVEAEQQRVTEHADREAFLNSFESQLGQIETKNVEQDNRLDKVEYTNKRQDVMLNGLFNENADGRLTIEGEGNNIKLEGSKEGLVEVGKVVGNTMCTSYYDNTLPIAKGSSLSLTRRFHAQTIKCRQGKLNDIIYYRVNLTLNKLDVEDAKLGIETHRDSGGYNISVYQFKTSDVGKTLDISTTRNIDVNCIQLHNEMVVGLNGELPEGTTNGVEFCNFTTNDYVVVNLTEVFGSGNEPTKEWCDKNIPYFEGMQSTFEDKIVTQEMVDSGLEKAENLGKYKADIKVVGKNKFHYNIPSHYIYVEKLSNGYKLILSPEDAVKGKSFYTERVSIKKHTKYIISAKIDLSRSTIEPDTVGANIDIINGATHTWISGSALVTTKGVTNIKHRFDSGNCDSIRLQFFVRAKISGEARFIDIQIEEDPQPDMPTTPSLYEPYKEFNQSLYLDEPLYKGDEICVQDGKLGVLHNSTDEIDYNNLKYSTTYEGFKFYECLLPKLSTNLVTSKINIISDNFKCKSYDDRFNNMSELECYVTNTKRMFIISNKELNELKELVKNSKFIYPLEEPIFVPILENTPQWVLDCFNSCTVQFETNVPISSSSFTYTGSVPSVMVMNKDISDIQDLNVDMVATTWDMDYRLLEVEWTLEDLTGVQVINLNNIKGGKTMALTRYEQAKIMILGGAYDKATLTKQLTRYLEKKIITQTEYDELIALMEAKELVTGE